MNATINPGRCSGNISAPPSKSCTQRAFAGALLHKGTTHIHNAGDSADELAALHIIRQLGAEVQESGLGTNNIAIIMSNGIQPKTHNLSCGESGLIARMFTPIVATSGLPFTISGNGSIKNRKLGNIKSVLGELCVSIQDNNGCLPFSIGGRLIPRDFSFDACNSSQLLTGLLFAYAFTVTKKTLLTVNNLESKPYIDLTLGILDSFGKTIWHNNYKEFIIDPAMFTHPEVVEINVEGDWSGAAFYAVAGAIAGAVTLKNLNTNSRQADRAILDIVQNCGAEILYDKKSITVINKDLKNFDFDASDCPDLFPILSVLAACCFGQSKITGLHRLTNKESNRTDSVCNMLEGFGVPYEIKEDTLLINGISNFKATAINSYNDHRIAMAAAIGGLRAEGPVTIIHSECVEKSYSRFFDDFEKVTSSGSLSF